MKVLVFSLLLGLIFSSEKLVDHQVVSDLEDLILIELFTSQGCSSCPLADYLLEKLNTEAKAGELPVVALSYHVDYWNRLGWKDPYSDAAFSARQRTYADKLADQRVYTPEMVINGSSGHVGSRESEIRKAIQDARKKRKNIPFLLSINKQKSDFLTLLFSSEAGLSNYILQIALVDGQVENEVPRGENRGRNLKHVQVVRQLQTLKSPGAKEEVEVQLTKLQHQEKGKIVAFLQEKNSWEVASVRELTW